MPDEHSTYTAEYTVKVTLTMKIVELTPSRAEAEARMMVRDVPYVVDDVETEVVDVDYGDSSGSEW